MNEEKLKFLQNDFIESVQKLNTDTLPKWGKMNAQQMVEHVTDFFKVSTKKLLFPLVTPVEHLPKYLEFLYSDKPFRENTKGPENIVPVEPSPTYYPTLQAAVETLEKEVTDFFAYFKGDADKKTLHPVFGELNFEEWVLLHYKHVTHHLRQFGLV